MVCSCAGPSLSCARWALLGGSAEACWTAHWNEYRAVGVVVVSAFRGLPPDASEGFSYLITLACLQCLLMAA